MPVSILSNSAGSRDDVGFKEAEKVEESLGITVIRHGGKKPLVFEEVMKHVNHTENKSKLNPLNIDLDSNGFL